MAAQPLLTVREVARQLGVCRAVVYELCQSGQLPHVRILNAIRVSPVAVAGLLAHGTPALRQR